MEQITCLYEQKVNKLLPNSFSERVWKDGGYHYRIWNDDGTTCAGYIMTEEMPTESEAWKSALDTLVTVPNPHGEDEFAIPEHIKTDRS